MKALPRQSPLCPDFAMPARISGLFACTHPWCADSRRSKEQIPGAEDLPDLVPDRYIAGLPGFEARARGACSGGRRVSMEIAGLSLVAVYEREVAASLERIWENVLDWEHLPWLHLDSFLAIDEVKAGPEGWRACVLLPPHGAPHRAWIEVCLDRAHQRYVTRTLAGVGEGTEIWTGLDPVADRVTRITVEFHLPGVPGTRAARNREVGVLYTGLYARLWDEDEGMMIRRQAVLDAPDLPAIVEATPLPLGPASSLRAKLPWVVDVRGARIRIVEIAGRLCAHTTVCPHLGGPLEQSTPDADGCVVCPWHGYRFDLRSGMSADGRRLALSPGPTLRTDASGEVFLVWSGA